MNLRTPRDETEGNLLLVAFGFSHRRWGVVEVCFYVTKREREERERERERYIYIYK